MSLFLHQDSVTSLDHQCSALQWMGAIRIRVQIADKNNSVIHTTPVHQLMTCEEKSCVFIRNKSIIKAFLTSNPCPLSSVHNIVFSNEKVILSESGEKYAQIPIYKKNSSKQMGRGFWCKRTTGDGLFYWRKYYFGLKTGILVKSESLKLKSLDGLFYLFKFSNFKTSKVNFTWCNSADLV